MRIVASGNTDAGNGNKQNEDYLVLDPALSLYVVCDGIGGKAAGEIAAKAAAEAARQYVVEHRHLLECFDESASSRDGLLRLVDEAIQFACREVFRIATSESGRAGMGTTLTMVLVASDFGVMGHVGDSRLYLHRAGRTDQLSEDHTYAAEAVHRGLMTFDEAMSGPYAKVITRAVGIQSSVRVDTLIFDLLPGDTLLLCSRGIHRSIGQTTALAGLLGDDEIEKIPLRLRDQARTDGSKSDATSIVLRAISGEDEIVRDSGRATQVNLRIDTLRRVVIFRHLDMREVCKVLNVVRTEEIEAGRTVIREGERSDALYAILHGTLRVERDGHLVRTMTAGDHFGEMALFNNRPRSATVHAQTGCGLLMMELARFNELLRTEPALSVKLLWCFAQVLSLRLDDVTGMLYDDADGPSDVAEELKNAPFSACG